MVTPTARVFANVELGIGSELGDFAVVGQPPRGRADGELPTRIGPGATIRSHAVVFAFALAGFERIFENAAYELYRSDRRTS